MSFPTSLRLLLCALLACSVPAAAQSTAEFSIDISSAVVSFPFRIRDAEFSKSLNAIVAVSESPNRLHIYKPETGELVSVNLQVPPTSVSVSPDGHFAVVGHNAWLSHVDLVNGVLLQTIPVSAVIYDVVLGGNGYAYAFPSGSFPPIHSIHLASETQSQSTGSIYGNMNVRLHPGGLAMYGAVTQASPADIEKYHIAAGTAEVGNDSPYHGDYTMCGNLWISVDGQRIYTACGNVFRSSTDAAQDMRYIGSLSQPVSIQWAEHTLAGSNLAVLPVFPSSSSTNGEIRYFTTDFLLYRGKAVLPRFVVEDETYAAHGRWVFFNAAGTKQYVIVQAETASQLTNDYGLVTVDCSAASVILNPVSASFGRSFATSQFSVTGTPGCGWSSTSDVSWINTNSSGVGDGTVTYTVSANTTVAVRNGTISVGGATFPISQAGVTPDSLVATATSPTSVSLTWSSAVAADHYEVSRSSGAGFTLIASPGTTGFVDTTVADTGYVYKVRGVAASGGTSEFSAPDYTHTFTLTDPVLSAGYAIRAVHVTELRTAINAIRAAAGVAPASFTDPSLHSVVAKRVHVIELREALNEARAALALAPWFFPTLPLNDFIRASTTEEVRASIR